METSVQRPLNVMETLSEAMKCFGITASLLHYPAGNISVAGIAANNQESGVNDNLNTPGTRLFGIYIHKASGTGTTKYADNYSAGCEVLANTGDFNLLIQLAEVNRYLKTIAIYFFRLTINVTRKLLSLLV